MIQEVSEYQVSRELMVSRYMNFTKFASMILNKTIFFTNGRALSDKYELSIGEDERSKLYKHYRSKHNTQEAYEMVDKTIKMLNEQKSKIYISCWTEEDDESYGMWKIYLGGKEGVSIVSNYNSIVSAFENSKAQFSIGKVKYFNSIDPSIGDLPTEKFVFRKRKYYRYEREVRIFYQKKGLFSSLPEREIELYQANISEEEYSKLIYTGFEFEIDLLTLIKQIRISPFAGKHFELLVRAFLDKTFPELSNRIITSNILDA